MSMWEVPADAFKKSEAQVIASNVIAKSVFPEEKEVMRTESRTAEVGSRVNPVVMGEGRREVERALCAADLDNIYNL